MADGRCLIRHRPSAIGHRSSAIGHRPSAIGHRPSAIGHRSSLSGSLPTMWDFPLFPEQASTLAGWVDGVTFYGLAITVFFTILICVLILFFAIKYRR